MAVRAPSKDLLRFLRLATRCPEASTVPRSILTYSNCLFKPADAHSRRTKRAVTYVHSHHAALLSALPSSVDATSSQFKSNAEANDGLLSNLSDINKQVSKGGSEKSRSKHLSKGKLLPRDRVTALLDVDSSFLELSSLAGQELYPGEDVPAGGIITGIGTIQSTPCMIVANDPTVKGGTYYPITVKKHLRAQAIAQQHRLPCVYLVDSGGANLPHQADLFPDREGFGRIFYNQANMSADGIPQISVVMGPCTAGGAYVPAMSDESIIVKEQGHIYLAGPPLVKAATGEDVTAEELGGGNLHTEKSGVADYLAVDDSHALALARRCIANLNHNADIPASLPSQRESKPPLHDAQEIPGIVPTSPRLPLPMREIIARIVDASAFAEFKPSYGTTLLTGFSHIHGHPCGILANEGVLLGQSSQKGAHFIQLCSQRRIPLIFLQNISGFMVGRDAEAGGIAKDGAKLVNAVATASVDKFTVVVGSSAGAGNYGMCGRAYDPNFLWIWPNAKTSVMGPEQLGEVMRTVRKGKREREDEELEERIRRESEALYSTARLWDDGIIDPRQTREYLGMGLGLAARASWTRRARKTDEANKWGVFRM
ncbi:MAG: hypothetical protein M1828_002716 [Chrysothrix sp. TS-e1954]|nr:MAG: hypothetical protein M1828_002716 [Chrysothrix sp. TS-e1954]